MSGTKKGIDFSPELFEIVLSTIDSNDDKELIRKIVRRFIDQRLLVTVKQYNQACMEGTYRILCFIKKSSEAVIINNKGMGRDGMSIQVRIENRSTLDKLNDFSENIKNQILKAGGCSYCSSKCEGKRYTFIYQKTEYVKCHMLCNNFYFQNMDKKDADNLIAIINDEIAYKQTLAK